MGSIEGASKVRAGSSITDELREGMSPCISDNWLTIEKSTFETLADRIDERHAVKVERLEKYRAAVDAMLKEYIKLPMDADGVPININDNVDGYGKMHRVCQLRLYTDRDWSFVDEHGDTYYDMAGFTHVKSDSWERIIEDALTVGWSGSWQEAVSADVHDKLVERCRRLAGDAE